MATYTRGLVASLLIVTLFTACSRPIAYFQPTAREHFSKVTSIPLPSKPVNQTPAVAPVVVSAATPEMTPTAQATQALAQVDALVRNDRQLVADKTVQKRLNRIRTMMGSATSKAALPTDARANSKKMNLMQHLMVKKLNRTISKQLAPANPEKAMAIKGILALGAIILLAGIIVLLISAAGTTGATIGVIGIIGGLILLLIGLI